MAQGNAPAAAGPRRRGRGRAVLVIGCVVAVVIAAGVWAVGTYGPAFNVYLTPPSPRTYADVALRHLDAGLRARGPQWDDARAEVTRAARDADSLADVHDALRAATRVAGGPHSVFLTPQEALDLDGQATQEFREPTVTTADGVTTVTVPAFGSASSDLRDRYARAAADGIAAAAPGTCGWVVDLRGNTGGDMHPMLAGVSALLPDGTAFELVERDGRAMAVTIRSDGVELAGHVTSVGSRAKVTGAPVAVLQDGLTGSSGEAVLTAFRGLDGVESFGEPSYGYTSGNASYSLYDGALMLVTVHTYVDRDGTDLGERPVEADHAVPADDADEAARSWLAQQGCGPG
ncbi:S41 family peptidase [Cellulomonas sp. zg-ZUI222]|uniref:S41 family peptidase n=1 Tax=Cellulomonas wangleii TaxID=2816956 RepID=UPI001A94D141|nr:S41 family peptidase [Cellulomonas wangleii]MBO0919845.1 S41 family peptidase [Cellulomonas wangleii]